jgi:lipoate---protein ligase
VVGRNQNPWKECHIQNMERDGVHLARRRSGGGAVYQDLGNTNFTFLSPRSGYSKERNMGIIIHALKKLGVSAECSGRNDILCGSKKISGSAFKLAHDRAFHHGTMLLSVDMSAMPKYLNPNKLKLESKGVKSVQARVMNLTELVPGLSHEEICENIRESFEEEYGQKTNVITLGDVPENNPYYKELKDWDWRFGETPRFTYELETRFDWGMMDVHIESDQGMIIQCRIFSDSLFPDMIDVMANALVKKPFDANGIELAMKEVASIVQSDDERACIKDFEGWMKLTI